MGILRHIPKSDMAQLRAVIGEMGFDPTEFGSWLRRSEELCIKARQVEKPLVPLLTRAVGDAGGRILAREASAEEGNGTTDLLIFGTGNELFTVCDRFVRSEHALSAFCERLKDVVDRVFSSPVYALDCGVKTLELSKRPHIMGVLNVTPDSFYDGGRYLDPARAVERAIQMAEEGADIIDVGGESTRPGSSPVDADEERARVIPVIQAVTQRIPVPVSIDTRKSDVADAAIEAGARIVNDVSGLRHDPEMAGVVAAADIPVVLMHIRGKPENMQEKTTYRNLIDEIYEYLDASIRLGVEAGISRRKMIVDPGIGFGKSWAQNYTLLNRLGEFKSLDCPMLLGVSRKSFIGWTLNVPEEERLMGTAAAVAACVLHGVQIIRVHDVKEMVQVVRIADRVRKSAIQSG